MKKFVRVFALLLIAAMLSTTALASEYQPIQNRYMPGWNQEAFGYREVSMTEEWVDETGKSIGTKTSAYDYDEKGYRVKEDYSEVDLVEDRKEFSREIYTYNSNDDYVKAVFYYSDESFAALKEDVVSTYEYDSLGRLLKEIDTNANGEVIWANVIEYEENVTIEKYYEGPVAQENLTHEYTFKFDSEGVLIEGQYASYTDGKVSGGEKSIYNDAGNYVELVSFYVDENGETVETKTTYDYDDEERCIKEVCGDEVTTHTYDENGNCVKTVTKNGDQEISVSTRTFNQYGQTLTEIYEDKQNEITEKYEYTYNEIGDTLTYTYNGELLQKYTYTSDGKCLTEEDLSSGDILEYTYDGYGNCTEIKYFIRNEAGKEILQATRKIEYEICAEMNIFGDVADDTWYTAPVIWANDYGFTTGVGEGVFAPDKTCTRAEVVTFLWRMAGEPASQDAECVFVDVEEDSWYTDAVIWAADLGITTGKDATHFDPTGIVSRAELVTFLSRMDGITEFEGENTFSDVEEDSWYADAVLWAVENDITTGKPGGIFDPTGECTRSETVTFMYRWFW